MIENNFFSEIMSQKKTIFVIGAGMSGMTCAQKLLECNLGDIKVLEASDRIGGRLYSFGNKTSSNGEGRCFL